MNTPLTFGEWLKQTREAQGFSQNYLAKISDVERSHIWKIEKARIAEPDEDTRKRLHAVFGTSDTDLVDLGILEARTYDRAHGPVTVYEYVKRPLVPDAQLPSTGDDFYAQLGEYLPYLGAAQRAHLIETARMMAGAAATRARKPAASLPADAGQSRSAPDRQLSR